MNTFDSNNFFDDFVSDLTAANLQSAGEMSIIEFANRIIFNNDPDFQLYPTQKAILKSFYNEPLTKEELSILNGWVDEERSTWVKDRKYISLILEAGRRASKALDLNTLIETPEGTKQFKDIKKGDYVFGINGDPVKVLNETEIFYDHNIYELTFSDGSKVKCDEGHLWKTSDKASRKAYARAINPTKHPSIKTTKEIVNSLYIQRKDGKLENNHSIELAKPLKYSKKDLLIHPYVLGYWLGDGNSATGLITSSKEDIDFVFNKFKKLGYEPYKTPQSGYEYRFTSNRLTKELKELGLLKNKHVPNNYIYSSISQRSKLLKGLMDTDGTVCCRGRATFVNTNFSLTDAVFKIANSLQCVATQSEYQGKCNGKLTKKYRKVRFRPAIFPFALPRKIKRYKPCTGQNNKRFIIKAELIHSIPVKCITVEGGLFLIDNNIITHNCNSQSSYITTTVGDITYKELHEKLSNKEHIGIYTYDIKSNITKGFVTYDIKSELNAIEQTYKIITETGKTEIINKNHPFLTCFNRNPNPVWKELKDLKLGDFIATSGEIPMFGTSSQSEETLKLWALSLLCNKRKMFFHESNIYIENLEFLQRRLKTKNIKLIKDKLVKYKKNIKGIDITSLDKKSTIIFIKYLLENSRRRRAGQDQRRELEVINRVENSCEISIHISKCEKAVASQLLKLGITSYLIGPNNPLWGENGLAIMNTNSIEKVVEIYIKEDII
jgi:hypothetical protein